MSFCLSHLPILSDLSTLVCLSQHVHIIVTYSVMVRCFKGPWTLIVECVFFPFSANQQPLQHSLIYLYVFSMTFWCVSVFLADIRMSKAAEEEKPGADYPGDSSGKHTHTYFMVWIIITFYLNNHHILMMWTFWDKRKSMCLRAVFSPVFEWKLHPLSHGNVKFIEPPHTHCLINVPSLLQTLTETALMTRLVFYFYGRLLFSYSHWL